MNSETATENDVMGLTGLLTELSRLGIKLWVEGEKLCVGAPAGVLSEKLHKVLTARKTEIISRIKLTDDDTEGLPEIVPDPDHRFAPFPLNDIQQAYAVGRSALYELGNVTTHMYVEIENKGLDARRLSQAWRKLIARHEMLRAVILPTFEQKILEQVPPYEIETINLTDLDTDEVKSRLDAIRAEMSHQVLPSDQWPLFDIRASRLPNGRIRLHFSIDLLITDFGSLMLIMKEWHQFYSEPDLFLPPLEVSFRDFVLTERAIQNGKRYQRSEAYWFSRLETLPPRPGLPLARNPASIEKPRFRRREHRLDVEKWDRLKEKARQLNLTSSGLLLAAFADIINAWSQEPQFTINLTQYNRLPLHPQVNDIVGNSISIILLAIENHAGESFAVRASRLQEQLWRDLDHTYISGVKVSRALARQQGRAAHSATMPIVFTSLLGLESFGKGLKLREFGEIVYGISQTPQVWLDHYVHELDGNLVYYWDSVDELFPGGMLDDMFAAYCRFLDALATSDAIWNDDNRHHLPPAQVQRRQAVNATAGPIPDQTLFDLFRARAENQPRSCAIISGGQHLTYEELFGRACQVGHVLSEYHIRPNKPVALVMEKGWEQIAAVLGILAVGAAYMPLDPDLPSERLQYMLRDGEIDCVLTDSSLDKAVDIPQGIHRLRIDQDVFLSECYDPPESNCGPDDLAYVLYTSGSTGRPKGVMVSHRGPVNTVLDINRRFGITADDRILGISALNFDLSVYDIFGVLGAGGTLVIPEHGKTRDPAHWLELMGDHRVTLWNSVPALMHMMVEFLDGCPQNRTADLRFIIMSGDWIPVELPNRIRTLWPEAMVVSAGGPTETSIWNVCYPIERIEPSWTSIPYGRPITNQKYHIFNELLEPRPDWVPGELYAEGIGLAAGYWRDHETTESKFIIHPQTKNRLYKTGDLGCYLPDGNIQIHGRVDFQVKINGHRIELAEIEASLRQHPIVRDAAVVDKGAAGNDKHLAAYIVLHPETERLPDDRSAGGRTDCYPMPDHDRVIRDKASLAEFKLGRPGLRAIDPGCPRFHLGRPDLDAGLRETYLARRSLRRFTDEPIPWERFSGFLSRLCPVKVDGHILPKYRYPSAGSLYCVQTYIHIKPGRVSDMAGGSYYYDPAQHDLVLLHENAEIRRSCHVETNLDVFDQAGFSLFLIGKLDAVAAVYGHTLARDFCLLEAGYIGQLLMDSAAESQIAVCPIGVVACDPLRDLFDLGPGHMLLHSFVGGIEDAGIAPTHRAAVLDRDGKINMIRNFLLGKLPEYMVPSVYVLVDALPLNKNGKVDRQLLPEPGPEPGNVPANGHPRSEIEQLLSEIVSDVLQTPVIGRDDNFFDVGANSVHLIKIHAKLKQMINVNIPITEFFSSPTVGFLAQFITGNGRTSGIKKIHDEVRKRKIGRQGRQRRRQKKRELLVPMDLNMEQREHERG